MPLKQGNNLILIRLLKKSFMLLISLGWGGVVAATLALAIAGGNSYWLSHRVDSIVNTNRYLASEIAKIDKDIGEVSRLKEQTAALLARKQIVEVIKAYRVVTPRLLDQVTRQRPDGVFFSSIEQR